MKEFRILTPDEVARLLLALPNEPTRLLVDTFVGTGLRWGEALELRPHDLDRRSGILTVTRAVVELHPEDHPTGGRHLVKPYPKNKQSRRFRLDPTLVEAITAHADQHDLASNDLLFPYAVLASHADASARQAQAGPAVGNPGKPSTEPGLTDPNPKGRRYPPAACPPTPPAPAGAKSAAPRLPAIAPPAGPTATTNPAHPARPQTPTDTFPGARGAPRSGTPRATPPDFTRDLAPTTCATPTPPGFSPAAPTSKSYANASNTGPSSPPVSTSTRCPLPVTRLSQRSTAPASRTRHDQCACYSAVSLFGRRSQAAPAARDEVLNWVDLVHQWLVDVVAGVASPLFPRPSARGSSQVPAAVSGVSVNDAA